MESSIVCIMLRFLCICRHVKDIYMKLGMFDFALKFAGPDEEKDVKLREAEFYYGRGE